jgi:hypothetical protein
MLNAARRVKVEAARRDAEFPERVGHVVEIDVVEIDARRAEAFAIEEIEELCGPPMSVSSVMLDYD